ncbi:MAG: MerR family transcriptional regulator [Bacteroidales bacterium]|nr:MerR family transcriptional regulator [Bacteroidales bacterium]
MNNFTGMERYTLNDLEKLTGIKAATIRIWERRYRLIKPHRTETNRRWYDDEDLRRIMNITILYRHDIKISVIGEMSGAEIEERVSMLLKGNLKPDIQIDSLILAMVNLDEAAINDQLMRSIINKGFAETFSGMVFPFLRRVGEMWMTGSVDVGAEHFVTNLFRRRLICAIDSLPPAANPEKKRVLMYLPEGEMHEMGLLFYCFVVRKMGHEVLYLGQLTPFEAVADVSDRWHPAVVITGGMTGLPYTKPDEYLRKISVRLNDKKILVAGALASPAEKMGLPNVFAFRSESDLSKYL